MKKWLKLNIWSLYKTTIKPVLNTVIILCLLCVVVPSSGRGQDTGDFLLPDQSALQKGAIESIESGPLADGEESQFKTLFEATLSQGTSGKWLEIDLFTSIMHALERNLTIMQAEGANRIAQSIAREAKAVFDPVINMTATTGTNKVNLREERVKKWKKNTTSYGADPNPVYIDLVDASPVAYLKYNKERVAGIYDSKVTASEKRNGTAEKWKTYRLLISKNLSWGIDMDLSLGVLDQEAYWTTYGEIYGPYNRPWRSTLTMSSSAPLPGAKDFGPYGEKEFQMKDAVYDINSSKHQAKTVINNILLDVELAFWDLVASTLNLKSMFGHIKSSSYLFERTKKLFEQQLVTEYDLAQVQSELVRSEQTIQVLVSDYKLVSNRLNELLGGKDDQLYLPMSYAMDLQNASVPLYEEVSVEQIDSTPELNKQVSVIMSAKLFEKFQDTQARPNIKITQSFSLTQRNAAYGFENLKDSLTNIVDNPDSTRQNYGLSYRYPIFNRAALHASEKASLNRKKEQVEFEKLKLQIIRKLKDAAIGLSTGRARADICKKNLELAKFTYDKASGLQESRDITEYEIVLKSVDLLNAKLRLVSATIDNRKSRTLFLGALGKLAEHHGTQ